MHSIRPGFSFWNFHYVQETHSDAFSGVGTRRTVIS